MSQDWRTVRVFISSTFRDMHAERDHLVRVVFPELKERCRKVRINIIDVDLRWGVTEEDAQGGKALDICLDEIDSCRPYFLGLLGHRYGFTPHGHEHSITAQEIYHGVLHNDIPRQIIDLRQIMEDMKNLKTHTEEQVNCLIRCYEWDGNKRKHILRDDTSDEERSIIQSIFKQYSVYQRDRSFFFFRSETLSKELAGSNISDFFESEKTLQDKLVSIKQQIIDERLPYFEYSDIETFGSKVGEVLWNRIEAEEDKEDVEKDWLKDEAEFHELFMADRTRRFVGRRDLLDKMHGFCENSSQASSIMVITGEPGCGKSALMARFSEEVIHQHPDWIILPHFVGASPNSTGLRLMLKRFCMQLIRAIGSNEEVPEDIKELTKKFPETLAKAAESNKVLFIIDAVNQLEKTDNAHSMYWLPQELSENVTFVISTLTGDAHDALMKRRITPVEEIVYGLEPDDVQELVREYLKEIRHEFPNKQVEADFFGKVKTGNPLYILVALEELRVFGKFEELPQRVAELPDNVPALFDQVLQRIENDFNPALVKDMLSYIACGRYGMTAEELQTLLKGHAPKIAAEAEAAKLPDMLWARLHRSFSSYLFERSGVIDFFHGQLKEAVEKRHLSEESEKYLYHKVIADYFEVRWKEPYNRAIDELPYQRTKAKEIEGIERILTDLEFIEFKCRAGMAYELVADYNRIGAGRASPGPLIITALLHKNKYGVFCPFCLAWKEIRKEQLNSIIACPACGSRLKVNPFVIEVEWKETVLQRKPATKKDTATIEVSKGVSEFADFVRSQLHILKARPELTFQQAINQPDVTGPYKKADILRESGNITRPYIRRKNKPQDVEPCIMTLEGTGLVTSCVYSPDGRRIVFGSNNDTLKVWDAETGSLIHTLEGHTDGVTSCAYSPDGRRIVSGSYDKTVKVWDAEAGSLIHTLEGHTISVESCAYSPDGRRIVSGSYDNPVMAWDAETGSLIQIFTERPYPKCIVKVWDAETGSLIHTLEGHTETVNSCAYSPDGRRIVSGSSDRTVKVWDTETGSLIHTLEGHTSDVESCAYSPDGRRIVSGAYDKTVKVWDAETGSLIHTLEGHTDHVNSCAYSPDGRRIVAGSNDRTVKVWDAETGSLIHTLEGHTSDVRSCAYSPDGRRIVSGSVDNTVKVWDAETGDIIHPIAGGRSDVCSYAYSPDGRRFVFGSESDSEYKTVKVVDTETWTRIHTLEGHADYVLSCAYSPDGRRIVSGSSDNTVKVWDAETGREIASFYTSCSCHHVDISTGNSIAASDRVWNIYILELVGIHLVERPLVIPVRIYLFDRKIWDDQISAKCIWCGKRFVPDESILDTIRNLNSHLSPDQSPCDSLPAEAWEDPRLLSDCPHCKKPLRFNPFIVDNSKSEYRSQNSVDRINNRGEKSESTMHGTGDNRKKTWWKFWKKQ